MAKPKKEQILPISDAKKIIDEAKAKGMTKCLVGCSGGKDSIITLAMLVNALGADNVEAFFMYHVKGLKCIESQAVSICKRFGVKLHMVPHFIMASYIKRAVLMPHRPALQKKIRLQKLQDVERSLIAKTGIEWFAYGQRASDTIYRRVMFKSFGSVWTHNVNKKLFPVMNWSTNDVLNYLKIKKIPIPQRFNTDREDAVSGFDPKDVKSLRFMQENHPEDFTRLCKVFTLAPAVLLREKMHGKTQGTEQARALPGQSEKGAHHGID